MPPNPPAAEKAPPIEMVDVRLIAATMEHDGKPRNRGDVFQVPRATYEASIVNMGLNPPRSRTFALLADEKAVVQAKADAHQSMTDRIKAVRESVADRESSIEASVARAKAIQADDARKLADSLLKPLERPGAHRVAG